MNLYFVILLCASFSCLVMIFVSYRDFRKTPYPVETKSCDVMFTGGYFSFPGLGLANLWNPRDCDLIFRESINESASCMKTRSLHLKKSTHIVLLGDSRLRQLRDGLIYQLSGIEHDFYVNRGVADDSRLYKAHESTVTEIEKAAVRVEYFWLTEMDAGNGLLTKFLGRVENLTVPPDIILVGGGLWMIRACTEAHRKQLDCALEFKRFPCTTV
ncbi:hypothetical protein RvY_02880 [Ramazzottius varieornatus]|uniref:Uncharacterized protein n=1 Tax=Ramazzottius varieornatus TaxID=947166 RepID=A0A1D1UM06_RAMVA|nr:hypothetical protein RvY_02880 [Ramazzottius varieornatus]